MADDTNPLLVRFQQDPRFRSALMTLFGGGNQSLDTNFGGFSGLSGTTGVGTTGPAASTGTAASASTPDSAPGTGPGSNATTYGETFGALGTLAGAVTGGFGTGLAGAALGTGIDVSNFNKDMERIGAPNIGIGGALSALANNSTYGFMGKSLDQQFSGMNLSGTAATAGLDTNNPEGVNSANASGGMHGVGETMDSGQTQDANESGGSRGVGETAGGVEGYGGNSEDGGHGGEAEGGGGGNEGSGGSGGGEAKGGLIRGPGTGTSDSILKPVSNGEFVATEKAVRKFGSKLYYALNEAAERGEDLRVTLHRPVGHNPFRVHAKHVEHDPFQDSAPIPGARKSSDGHWYVKDPTRPGKWAQVGTVH